MTDSVARASRNPEHVQLLSEHRRIEKGRKALESQVHDSSCLLFFCAVSISFLRGLMQCLHRQAGASTTVCSSIHTTNNQKSVCVVQ